MGAIEHPPIVRLPGIPDHVLYTWVVMVILVGLALAATRSLSLVPRGTQNFMEVVIEQFIQLIDDVIGPAGRAYLPLIATLGLFILVSNLMGLVPGLISPTGNLMTNGACAIIVFLTYHYIGIKKQGLVPYLNHFSGPMPWSLGMAPIKLLMIPIELISHLARPLSLTLRLFGNMTGGHILLAIIFFLMGLDGLLGWALSGSVAGLFIGGLGSIFVVAFTLAFLYPLKILVSFLQAFIFVMLTMLYVSGAIEHAEHGEHGEHHADAHH
jgi:F-type H+-transporting ATPase subunit a